MAKRRVAAIVKIQIQAGAATPAPPVGTALGPHGINIMDFCKAYNASTESHGQTHSKFASRFYDSAINQLATLSLSMI